MCEIWKDISGFEGFYQVSNLGRVRSLARDTTVHSVRRRGRTEGHLKDEVWHRNGKILSYVFQGSDVPYVRLYKGDNGSRISVPVRLLVAQAFLDAPKDCSPRLITHINENRLDCAASNLRIEIVM